MAARFTRGDSNETTRSTVSTHKVREPPTRSDRPSKGAPRRGNTMNGMPSWIDAGEKAEHNPGNFRGGKTIKPRGPPGKGDGRDIGKKGGGNTAGRVYADGAGTMGGRSAWMSGHRGRMERLAGKAKTFGERKGGKTNMY